MLVKLFQSFEITPSAGTDLVVAILLAVATWGLLRFVKQVDRLGSMVTRLTMTVESLKLDVASLKGNLERLERHFR